MKNLTANQRFQLSEIAEAITGAICIGLPLCGIVSLIVMGFMQ